MERELPTSLRPRSGTWRFYLFYFYWTDICGLCGFCFTFFYDHFRYILTPHFPFFSLLIIFNGRLRIFFSKKREAWVSVPFAIFFYFFSSHAAVFFAFFSFLYIFTMLLVLPVYLFSFFFCFCVLDCSYYV
jgi:hypothetical protein